MKKTNAMRILDRNKVNYEVRIYDISDDKIDGMSVADKVGVAYGEVFKTLVTQGKKGHYVFVIEVNQKLDLKKAAETVGEKKIEMLSQRDLKQLTGYIHGGCSPVGMKKLFPTVINTDAENLKQISVSAGTLGMQVVLNPLDLAKVTGAKFADITFVED
ncbi:MAG: Cys-tRNA(Pro) deacylase [Peptoniphilus sp.]|nr:Cys-tRNA(Pro) deacylase [Peptoniphilus sp.]